MRFFHALIIALSLSLSGEAMAVCGLTLTANNVTINWDLNFTSQAISVTLNKANAPECYYWIGFTKGGAASAATRRLNTGASLLSYQLYKENAHTNILKDSSDAAITSANEVLDVPGYFPAGTNINQNLQYYFVIPSATTPTIAKDGTYTDTYTLNVYEGADPTVGSPTPVTSGAVVASVTIPKMIKMSLVPSGGSFEEATLSRSMDFGILAPGQSSTFDLRVRTNAGVDVTFSSANNGKLKPPANPASPGVPYSFYANAALLNLSNSLAVPVLGLSASGQTNMEGLAYPIRVVIGSFAAATVIGGQQEDVITITATTTE